VEDEAVRTRYAHEVQCALLEEFSRLLSARPDPIQRLNALQPLRETLQDWRLRPKYFVSNNEEEDWVFGRILSETESVLQEEIEAEADRAFQACRFKEWERRSWTQAAEEDGTSTIAPFILKDQFGISLFFIDVILQCLVILISCQTISCKAI
jgi:hypothetical protein